MEVAASTDKLYHRLYGYYQSRLESVQERDRHVITGKAWQDIIIGHGTQVEKRRLWYMVKVEVEEGLYPLHH